MPGARWGKAASADWASRTTTGTVQGSRAGFPRAGGRGATLISSGESSGAVRSDGSSRTVSAGLPAWIAASVLAGAAKGCGRADRTAWLWLLNGQPESSAHRHSPSWAAQNPCSTSMRNRSSNNVWEQPNGAHRQPRPSCCSRRQDKSTVIMVIWLFQVW